MPILLWLAIRANCAPVCLVECTKMQKFRTSYFLETGTAVCPEGSHLASSLSQIYIGYFMSYISLFPLFQIKKRHTKELPPCPMVHLFYNFTITSIYLENTIFPSTKLIQTVSSASKITRFPRFPFSIDPISSNIPISRAGFSVSSKITSSNVLPVNFNKF